MVISQNKKIYPLKFIKYTYSVFYKLIYYYKGNFFKVKFKFVIFSGDVFLLDLCIGLYKFYLFCFYIIKKLFIFLFFLTLSQANAQWEYKVNNTEKTIEAIGGLQFKTQFQDTIILNLSKSRKLGLDFSIQGKYFKSGEKYYVLFEISDRKIKVLRSINERNRFRIFEVKDLISKEKYELEDFLKILKEGEECVLTIRSNTRVIQGYNQLTGSGTAINNILKSSIP